MQSRYSPQEAVKIALAHYDELRSRGQCRDDALENTVEHFGLRITPRQLDELVIIRDRRREYEDALREGRPLNIPDTFPEEWVRHYGKS